MMLLTKVDFFFSVENIFASSDEKDTKNSFWCVVADWGVFCSLPRLVSDRTLQDREPLFRWSAGAL